MVFIYIYVIHILVLKQFSIYDWNKKHLLKDTTIIKKVLWQIQIVEIIVDSIRNVYNR